MKHALDFRSSSNKKKKKRNQLETTILTSQRFEEKKTHPNVRNVCSVCARS